MIVKEEQEKLMNRVEDVHHLLGSKSESKGASSLSTSSKRLKNQQKLPGHFTYSGWVFYAQSHWFMNCSTTSSFSLFCDGLFHYMLHAVIPPSLQVDGPPILSIPQLIKLVDATCKYEFIQKEMCKIISHNYECGFCNQFCQCIHDSVTLNNKNKLVLSSNIWNLDATISLQYHSSISRV